MFDMRENPDRVFKIFGENLTSGVSSANERTKGRQAPAAKPPFGTNWGGYAKNPQPKLGVLRSGQRHHFRKFGVSDQNV